MQELYVLHSVLMMSRHTLPDCIFFFPSQDSCLVLHQYLHRSTCHHQRAGQGNRNNLGRKEKPRQEKLAERKGVQQQQSRRGALGLEQEASRKGQVSRQTQAAKTTGAGKC